MAEYLRKDTHPPFAAKHVVHPGVAEDTIGSLSVLRIITDMDGRAKVATQEHLREVPPHEYIATSPLLAGMQEGIVEVSRETNISDLLGSAAAVGGARMAARLLCSKLKFDGMYGGEAIKDDIMTRARALLESELTDYAPEDRPDIHDEVIGYSSSAHPEARTMLASRLLQELHLEAILLSPAEAAERARQYLYAADNDSGIDAVLSRMTPDHRGVTEINPFTALGAEDPVFVHNLVEAAPAYPHAEVPTPKGAFEQGALGSLAAALVAVDMATGR